MVSYSQTNHSSSSDHFNHSEIFFFKTNQVFSPTKASIFEAKNGVVKYISDENLQLNIGTQLDLIGIQKNKSLYSIGIDAFTFSNLRSEDNFKFPVDAIDYFFGLNLNMKNNLSENKYYSLRFRISHISSHFEDGHKYENIDTIFTPIVYSREFMDLSGIYYFNYSRFGIKTMFSINYLFHSIPANVGKVSLQEGIEINYWLSKIISIYVANDLRLAKVNGTWNLNENMELGVSFGEENSRKVNVFFTYYDGQDFRGQYFSKYLNYKGVGFNLIF